MRVCGPLDRRSRPFVSLSAGAIHRKPPPGHGRNRECEPSEGGAAYSQRERTYAMAIFLRSLVLGSHLPNLSVSTPLL